MPAARARGHSVTKFTNSLTARGGFAKLPAPFGLTGVVGRTTGPLFPWPEEPAVSRAWTVVLVAALAASVVVAAEAPAGKTAAKPAAKAAAPPLPLHTLEGPSGVYLTQTAYFANLPEGDGLFGKPSFAFSGVKVGHKDLEAFTVTTNVLKRFELSYSFQRLGLGDFPHDVKKATGISIDHSSLLHTLGLRAMVVREGEGSPSMPAITLGVLFKKNTTIDDINDDLGGLLKTLSYRKDHGVDFTAVASKTFVGVLPKPFILSAGVRNTSAILGGFGGFGNDRHTVFEGHAIFFLTDRLVFAAEYRQMPHELRTLGKLIRREDDWWSMAFAYVFNNNLTGTIGFAHLGRVLNHHEGFCPLAQLKWEF